MERNSAREELVALQNKKESIEKRLEAMSQKMKSKEEEFNIFAVSIYLFPACT